MTAGRAFGHDVEQRLVLPDQMLVAGVTEALERALREVVGALSTGRIEQEADLTSQFVGEIRGELRRGDFGSHYQWDIKVLTDRGPGAQEKTYGADLLVVQSFDLADYKLTKGFLAQAKLRDKRLDRPGLADQCQRMLRVTPDAFVFEYAKSGINVISASAAMASGGQLDQLRAKSFNDFLAEFMTSFIGDPRLDAATAEAMRTRLEEREARVGVFVRTEEGRA